MFASTARALSALVLISSLGLLSGCSGTGGSWLKAGSAIIGGMGSGGGGGKVADGLKEALRVGTETVVGQLGRPGGFNRDRAIRIPLPKGLQTPRNWLGKIGMDGSLNELETRLNRAAEAATPKVKKIFWQAIREMSISDAMAIFNGPQDAATQYFRRKMGPDLRAEMRPVVERSLSQVGVIQKYDEIVSRYNDIPLAPRLAPDIGSQLGGYTSERALDGIFYYLAREEAAIRQNPAKRTTELLRSVFGAQSGG